MLSVVILISPVHQIQQKKVTRMFFIFADSLELHPEKPALRTASCVIDDLWGPGPSARSPVKAHHAQHKSSYDQKLWIPKFHDSCFLAGR